MNPERADCPIGHRVPLIQVKPEPDVAGIERDLPGVYYGELLF